MAHFSRLRLCLVIAISIVFAGAWTSDLRADAEAVEVRELKAMLELSQQQLAATKAELALAEQRRRELVSSLAESVQVSEEQVARAREVELKLQAFGVDLLSKDDNSLEQRLLKAVRDLDISQQELESCSAQLHSLSERFLNYLAATPEAPKEARSSAEDSIRMAGELVAGLSGTAEETIPGDLTGARVVSVETEIGLVVLNAGKRSGLRVGTPVSILKGEEPVYSAMIIDVRDSISGAVLQDRLSDSDNVAVGDGVELLPNQTNL